MHNRIEWVDVCRGLAILAIFIGHIAPGDNLTTFVFRYHVPLFFFLSGFFFSKNEDLTFRQYLKKVVKITLIPYFMFCLINIVFFTLVNEGDIYTAITYIKQAILGVRNQMDFGIQLWFFTCLFSVQIMYFVMFKILKKKLIIFIVTIVFALASSVIYNAPHNPTYFFNIDSAFYYVIFFCLGDILFPNLKKITSSEVNVVFRKVFLIISIFITLIGLYVYSNPVEVNDVLVFLSQKINGELISSIILQTEFILLTLLLILLNIVFSVFLQKSNYLSVLGKNTMILCGNETISIILSSAAFSFLGIVLKTELFLYKIFYMFIKVEIIRILLLRIYNKYLPWIDGRTIK